MVRERISRDYLLDMKITVPIHVVPDLSFLLAPASEDRISEIISNERLDVGHPLVGIAIRENMIQNLDLIAEVVNHLILTMDARIIFVPHTSISPAGGHFYCIDPKFRAKEIIKKVKVKENVSSIENEYTVEELRGIIGKCDVFVGGFMHANLSALSMCVPTLALSYSHKTEGIMNLVGLDEFVLPLNDLDAAQLINKIEKLYNNHDELEEKLRQRIPTLKKMAMKVGYFVKLTERTV